MNLLETGLKVAQAQQLLPADQDFAFLAVKDGEEYTIGLVARGGTHWNVAMEIGRTPVHPGWDWKVGVFGKFPWKGEK